MPTRPAGNEFPERGATGQNRLIVQVAAEVCGEFMGSLITLQWITLQRLEQNRFQIERQARVEPAWRWGISL